MSTTMFVVYVTRRLLEDLVSNSSFSPSFAPDSVTSVSLNTSNPSQLIASTGMGSSDGANNSDSSPYSLSPRFNPSMAIIIVILLSAFFFMGFFSVYIRRCNRNEDLNRNNSTSPEPRSYEGLQQGLDESIVESLPMISYSAVKNLETGEVSTECVVCLNEFQENETLKLLPQCGHAFHEECINMWLFSHTTCPLCRECLLRDRGSFRGLAESFRRLLAATLADAQEPVRGQGGAPAIGTEAEVSIVDVPICVVREEDGTQQTVDVSLHSGMQDGASRNGSPIYGVVGTPRSKSRTGRDRRLRRSNSTGHSPRNQSPPEGSSSQSIPFHLKLIGFGFRRSISYTNLSEQWSEGRDLLGTSGGDTDKQANKGWRNFTIRRTLNMKRPASDDHQLGTSMLDAFSRTRFEFSPETVKPALSSVRRKFKRLAGMEKRQDSTTAVCPNQDNEFSHYPP
eukprot:c53492_g1_i1 orf=570-1928(+)